MEKNKHFCNLPFYWWLLGNWACDFKKNLFLVICNQLDYVGGKKKTENFFSKNLHENII